MSAYLGVGHLLDGKYRIIRVIGEGGWGVVYEGENPRTLKRVAIKVLRAHAGVTPDIRSRFEREAQAGGRIGSPHIVEVFDLGALADGTLFMVMELLVGEDLATRLRSNGPLDPVVAAKLVLQLLEGLRAAHGAGIFHRDLKPENLFLLPTRSGEDFLKILDFGVSKFAVPGLSATRTGAVLGSPFYMAPEQARGLKHIDGRTDLYSVGAVLFESVTGRVPFEGDNFNELMFKIALSPRPNPLHLRSDLDPDLGALIVQAISADPRERFASAEEFHRALTRWLQSQGVASVITPDVRQAAKPSQPTRTLTDSAPLDPLAPRGTPETSRRVVDTPLASSSRVRGTGAGRRRAVVASALVGVALVAMVAGSGWASRQRAVAQPATPLEEHTRERTPATIAVEPPAQKELAPPPAETLAPPAPEPPAAAPASSAVLAPSWATSARPAPHVAAGPALPPIAHPATAKPGIDGTPAPHVTSLPDGSAPVPPVRASAASSANGAHDATPTAATPFEKIEGREVRTGL